MRRFRLARPRHSTAVAYVALFVALGGTSYAALALPKNSVGSKQLKKNAVTRAKIKKNSVISSKVKNRSLLAKDFKAGQLPRGPRGLPGPSTGPAGGVLGGSYPNPRFQATVNALVPIAIVMIRADGSVVTETHRAPVTGRATVTHTSGSGEYVVNFPGWSSDTTDPVLCTRRDNAGEIAATTSSPDDMDVETWNTSGTPVNVGFQCAVYDLPPVA